MTEQWKPVVGFEGLYEVSSRGRVRSLPHSAPGRPGVVMHFAGKVLPGSVNPQGYIEVGLSRDGVRTLRKVHRLVLEAFVGPRPDGTEGCHGDGDPGNNRLTNLRWDTRSANTYDKVRHGTHPMAAKTACKYGHPYTDENTYRRKNGARQCRTCRREQSTRRAA